MGHGDVRLQTTRYFGPALLAAAAEAKAVLLELAAEALNVPQAQLIAQDGLIFDAQNKEHPAPSPIGQGSEDRKAREDKPVLKACNSGDRQTALARDARDKVTGKAQYAGDLRAPDMLYAKF